MWKNRNQNMYPKVLLSDCFITNISLEAEDIVLDFSEYGFFVFDDDKNNYFRTDGGQLRIEGCNIDNISIEEIRTQKLSKYNYFKTMHDIEINDFARQINSSKIKFEIVEEFYGDGSAFITAMIGPEEDKYWCYIRLYFNNIAYLWNNIVYDWPY